MNNQIIWLDYVRAIACCMVVLLHIAAEFVLKSNNYLDWQIANIVDSFMRICVPLFFMISGYLFFSEKTVKAKNFIKIITALLFYSSIALLAAILFTFIDPNKPFSFSFFNEPSFYHLWYFYPLIAIYLLSLLIKIRELKFNYYVLIFLLFFTFFNPQINSFFSLIGIKITNYFFINSEFFYYVLYGLTGASLRYQKSPARKTIFIYIIASIIIAYLTHLTKHNKLWPFYNYTNPLVFFAAFSFFSHFKSRENTIKPNKIITLISKNSLGIYGIHAFIIYAIAYFSNFHTYNAIITIPLIFIITLVLSLLFSTIIKLVDKKGYIS